MRRIRSITMYICYRYLRHWGVYYNGPIKSNLVHLPNAQRIPKLGGCTRAVDAATCKNSPKGQAYHQEEVHELQSDLTEFEEGVQEEECDPEMPVLLGEWPDSDSDSEDEEEEVEKETKTAKAKGRKKKDTADANEKKKTANAKEKKKKAVPTRAAKWNESLFLKNSKVTW
jgi:hypothetical protein